MSTSSSIAMSTSHGQGKASRTWLIFAFSCFLSLSVGNFLAAVIGSNAALPSAAGLGNFQMQMLTLGVVGLVGSTALLICCPKRIANSSKRFTVLQLISGMFLSGGNLACFYGIGSYPQYASLLTAVLPMSAVLVAVTCWLVLRQPLTRMQIFGVLLSFVGLVCMAAGGGSNVMDGLPGLAFGALAAFCFGLGNLCLKVTATNGLDKLWGACLLAMGEGIGGLVVLFMLVQQGHNPFYGLYEVVDDDGSFVGSRRLFVLAAVSAFMQILVAATLKLSVALGPAAPANAIGNANAVGVFLLEVIFMHSTVSVAKAVGLILVVVGVGVMAMAASATVAQVEGSQDKKAKRKLADLEC